MKKKYLNKIHIFRTKTKINDDLILKKQIIDDLRLIYNNIKKIMEYQKIINLLDDTKNQPSKFRTRNSVEINDKSKGRYDNSNIRFKTSMIGPSL